MIKNNIKLYLTIVFSIIMLGSTGGFNAYADEEFWVTYIDTPYKEYKGEDAYLGTLDNLLEGPNIITIKGNKMILNQNNCEVTIDKIKPFSLNRVLVDMITDAGGDKRFDQFLKQKLHTDKSRWKTEYLVKFPPNKADRACAVLQSTMIYRSPNELIITDTGHFYRAVLRENKPVKDLNLVKGYFFPSKYRAGSCKPITEKAKEQFKYCAYPDEIDGASHWKFQYKCFSKGAIDYNANDFQLYDTKKSCVDDYNRLLEDSEFQG